MKVVLLIDEGSLRRVRSAIERVDQVSKRNHLGRHGALDRPPLVEAAEQLIASLRSTFRIICRER